MWDSDDYSHLNSSYIIAIVGKLQLQAVSLKCRAKNHLMDRLRSNLLSAESALHNLDHFEKASRECVAQLTEEQWQQRHACVRSQKALVEDALRSVHSRIGVITKKLCQRRRSRKLRKANRRLHKQLQQDAQVIQNKRANLVHENLLADVQTHREQAQLDQISREDANCMLKEISQKKKDLISFHQKVIALENYRLTVQGEPTGKEANTLFEELKEKVVTRLMRYNKEESYIRGVLRCSLEKTSSSSTTIADEKQRGNCSVKQLGQWESVDTLEEIINNTQPERAVSDVWSKYVDLASPNSDCQSNCPPDFSVLSPWEKYSLPEETALRDQYYWQ